jgi:multiple sugar transport system substrate-binding protein
MTKFTRRDAIKLGVGATAAAGLAPLIGGMSPAAAQDAFTPEKGASLRVLRWSPFVKGDEESWIANTKKFTETTGIEVRIDK